jgi:hypothetical protein
MRDQILQLLRAIDDELVNHATPGERLDLYLIGRASLILRLDLPGVMTTDVDIVHLSTSPNAATLEEVAIQHFGKGSANAARLGLYLERVPQGMPPVPHQFRNRSTDVLPGQWRVIRPKVLEYHDFAVTKLKRFAAKDREDLKRLCDLQLLNPDELQRSLDNAFAFAAEEEEDPARKCAYDAYRKVRAYLETGQPTF